MSSVPATLYVPVHKRSTSSSTSSRSTTPVSENEDARLPVYSIQELLMLSKSPLAAISSETREHLKDIVPDITLSRKQRKAIEHKQHVQAQGTRVRAQAQVGETKESPGQPLVLMHNPQQTVQRRSPRQGRLPERRRNAKLLDERTWMVPRLRTIPSPLLLLTTASA